MRERVKRYFDDFEKAYINLDNAIREAKDDLDIDGTIKRFELCYELSWKLIKEYLADMGTICNNPRDTFKQAFINELIDDDEKWLKMIEDRNHLVHVYTESQSREIFASIKNLYISSFRYLYDKMKNRDKDA